MKKAILITQTPFGAPELVLGERTAEEVNTAIMDKMEKGVCHFAFTKKDGTTREAFGTLKPTLLPPKVEGAVEKPAYDHLQNYFDVEADDWRAYTKANVIACF
jgi:hypothetical protein